MLLPWQWNYLAKDVWECACALLLNHVGKSPAQSIVRYVRDSRSHLQDASAGQLIDFCRGYTCAACWAGGRHRMKAHSRLTAALLAPTQALQAQREGDANVHVSDAGNAVELFGLQKVFGRSWSRCSPMPFNVGTRGA